MRDIDFDVLRRMARTNAKAVGTTTSSGFVTGLLRRLADADHLVREAESRFDIRPRLRFQLENWQTLGGRVGEIDLGDRLKHSGDEFEELGTVAGDTRTLHDEVF